MMGLKNSAFAILRAQAARHRDFKAFKSLLPTPCRAPKRYTASFLILTANHIGECELKVQYRFQLF
jgi:hypothetical protein